MNGKKPFEGVDAEKLKAKLRCGHKLQIKNFHKTVKRLLKYIWARKPADCPKTASNTEPTEKYKIDVI